MRKFTIECELIQRELGDGVFALDAEFNFRTKTLDNFRPWIRIASGSITHVSTILQELTEKLDEGNIQ